MKLDIELFRRLCEAPGIPGREERVRELVEKTVLGKAGKGMFDSSHVDSMGSLICTRKATK
ncbi:MAG: M42 family peptidase, partial [Planctomycetota bacterium]